MQAPEPHTGWAATLQRVSTAALPQFFDAASGLLAERRTWNGVEWERSQPGPVATANALVGLHALRSVSSPIGPPGDLLDRFVQDHLRALTVDCLAWTLWADAIGAGRHLGALSQALAREMAGTRGDSMLLAWTLAALCHCARHPRSPAGIRATVDAVASRLASNQCSSTGLFFASDRREGWLRRRRSVASLSAQSYAVHALATYGALFDQAPAIRRATDCADCLVGLQGPGGQWWWRYDVRSGRVVEPYPVYAVNQDSAMPLALGALHQVAPRAEYGAAVAKGLEWEFGANEVGRSLLDEANGIICRGIKIDGETPGMIQEMRGYHPGRCLYACSVVPEMFSAPAGAAR